MRLRLLFCLLLTSIAAQAQTPTQAPRPFSAAQLDSLLDDLAATNKILGSLALSRGGQPLYSRAFGYAEVATKTPATPTTRYRIGSVTKVFTATMIMQLVDEKKLTLDTPLGQFFPQLPNAATITIDQLLSHRSGLHDVIADPAYGTYLTGPKTQAEVLALIARTTPDFEPGTKYAFSNPNYAVLGYIVEKLTKIPYAQAVQQRIGEKIGLTSTYYGGKINPKNQEARSYKQPDADWKLSPETDLSVLGGAGAMVSTPAELNRFLAALFGGKLVSAASLATMQTMRNGYGRGLMDLSFDAKKGYGHGGEIDDFATIAFFFPADKLAVTMCTNGCPYPLSYVFEAALSMAYHLPYSPPEFAPSFAPDTGPSVPASKPASRARPAHTPAPRHRSKSR